MRAAVVGYGNIGPVHARAIAALPGANLAAVCDLDPARLEAARAELGEAVEPYADFEEMLERGSLDVVHVCTPHHLHEGMAIRALRAGCRVLLEKPMALDSAGAARLERAWRESGLLLGLCFQNRYRPSIVEAKRILDSREYGAVLGIRAVLAWRRDAAYYAAAAWKGRWATEGGGVLINQAIHTLDLVQWLGGGCVSSAGIGGNLALRGAIEVEDSAVVSMELAGGARGIVFATNGWAEDSPVEIELLCEGARIRLSERSWIEERGGGRRELPADGAAPSDAARAYWGAGHGALIEDFYARARDGQPFPIDPIEGMKTMAILDAAYAGIGRPRGEGHDRQA
jgi:UDP-N-acetyl-2-amino-2-deoxyglucuronate dehydrogenase